LSGWKGAMDDYFSLSTTDAILCFPNFPSSTVFISFSCLFHGILWAIGGNLGIVGFSALSFSSSVRKGGFYFRAAVRFQFIFYSLKEI
jgi:hypothetical protein